MVMEMARTAALLVALLAVFSSDLCRVGPERPRPISGTEPGDCTADELRVVKGWSLLDPYWTYPVGVSRRETLVRRLDSVLLEEMQQAVR